MGVPQSISWTPPTQNTDGTPIAAGELTGFLIGIRKATDPQPNPDGTVTYPQSFIVKDPTATSEAFGLLGATLTPGDYLIAMQTLSTTNGNSAYTAEVPFTITSTAKPNPPSGFTLS